MHQRREQPIVRVVEELDSDWQERAAEFFASLGPEASAWPEDVAAIYQEINEEDRRLAEAFSPTIGETWPPEQQP